MTTRSVVLLFLHLLLSCGPARNETDFPKQDSLILSEKGFSMKILEQKELQCLDTKVLEKNKVAYRLIEIRDTIYGKPRLTKKWSLQLNVPLSADHVASVDQYYSASIYDDCSEKMEYFPLDSLVIHYPDGRTETKITGENSSALTLSPLKTSRCRLIDLNFDGFDDIEIFLDVASGVTNGLNTIYLFNPNNKSYGPGIPLSNYSIDANRQLIYHSWNIGGAGDISTRIWSDFDENGELRTRRIEERGIDHEIGKVILKTHVFDKRGRKKTTIDTVDRHH